jgi:hypothetical protein
MVSQGLAAFGQRKERLIALAGLRRLTLGLIDLGKTVQAVQLADWVASDLVDGQPPALNLARSRKRGLWFFAHRKLRKTPTLQLVFPRSTAC